MVPFFLIPKRVLKKLDYYTSMLFVKAMNIRGNTDLLGGAFYRFKYSGVYRFWIWNFRISVFQSKAILDEDGSWQNILKRKYLKNNIITKWQNKQGIHISRKDLWKLKVSSWQRENSKLTTINTTVVVGS